MPPLVSPQNDVWETSAEIPCTDDVSLPRSGYCFSLVKANFPRGMNNQKQIWVVTRHQYGNTALVSQMSFARKRVEGSWDVGCFLRLDYLGESTNSACLWVDFQDTRIRKNTQKKYSQNSLEQQGAQRQCIISVYILNRGVCTEVENLGSLMSLGRGELSVIKGCLYNGGRDCTKFGIFANKRTVHNKVFVLWGCLQGEVQLYHHQGIIILISCVCC